VFVTGRREVERGRAAIPARPESVVIVGGGAAGFAAAEMLRREGYEGPVTMVSADASPPYDRPNASKDYLAGNAPEEWMPLRGDEWYEENGVTLMVGRRVARLLPAERQIEMEDGERLRYGALLLATGAEPVRLELAGGDRPHVHYLRSLADSRAIVAALGQVRRAVVVGASFIGLEVAASLRERGLEVHVVAPEAVPMDRILGDELGGFVRALHEEHGVRFHMGRTVGEIAEKSVTLDDGDVIEAELVVLGVGVRPNVQLAEAAGLKVERGVVVDEQLRTSADGVWAAGDIARWPDRYTGQAIRVEHWVVAERQGQAAARNMLGRGERFEQVPFFWSQHYDVPINYVGHAEGWDSIDVTGKVADRDCVVAYRKEGKTLAVASIYRDGESLEAELAMERGDEGALRKLVPGR
jgi:NADPH-dependent 2,4-dienoyl-CoA reductase/sulfur reductase-like enzyme